MGRAGQDFPTESVHSTTRTLIEQPQIKHIVTNPPYSYKRGIGDKFVGQALRTTRQTGGKVAMLLNLRQSSPSHADAKMVQRSSGQNTYL